MSKPILIAEPSIDEELMIKINKWFTKVDEEYKKLLTKLYISNSILFIGQKE